ncbi:hypothetical protein [Leifsonia sp. PS1209]|uniref:hypothetical protein n=1 Tax=Leifsonia sp. PS1209 TaxID=2724914 RepID=UPI001442CC8D|nr:hypothetical protein [Leifsonia sp. PS1209]QIZ98307.1 hypothetical protein HF024_07105 [Leifsonia sp. PS1209]
MSTLMDEFAAVQRRRRRVALLMVAAIVAGVAAWLTGPIGIVMIGFGDAAGWALAAAGLVLLAAMIVAIVAAVRTRVAPSSQPGKANLRFDDPLPSRNPNGGNAMNGFQIGS